MRNILRIAGYALGGLALLALLAALGIYLVSQRALSASTSPRPEALAASSTSASEAHRRMITLGCADCHGEGLRGDKFIDDPKLGTIWAPNLTEVAARASDQELAQAIRQGIGVDGRPLFIMPSLQYRFLTDTEVTDVIRAIRAVPRSGNATPPIKLGPLARVGIVTGRLEAQPAMIAANAGKGPPDLGAATAAGRHLVATHCSECHGMDLKGHELKPGTISTDLTIAGAYDDAAFAALLRTGRPADGRDLKLMDDVAKVTFAHFTDAEIAAIHAYLKARADAATN
jgi:mono/diheme cytochrome c family protein